jgi:cytochrome bd-type quinol oxidase subunit 2
MRWVHDSEASRAAHPLQRATFALPARERAKKDRRLSPMLRFLMVLLAAVAGFIVAAVAGYFLVMWFSSNVHDRALEAAMTSVFVSGPIGAIAAALWAFIRGRRTS